MTRLFQKGEAFMPGKVRLIPANTNEPMKHVVIYARVSSNTMDQLESLKAQIFGLTKFVSGHNNWKMKDSITIEKYGYNRLCMK